MDRGIRIAALFLVAGLLVELFTLNSIRPPAFLIFVGVGGVLFVIGIGLYLITLLRGLVPNQRETP